MTEETAHFLLTADGDALLERAAALRDSRTETLTALTRLRKFAPPDMAVAAWELADLRRRATMKFGTEAAHMFFTRESLEQASSQRAAEYHAQAFASAGVSQIIDLCGGIGGDALAFARQGLSVTLYELDPVRALFARANARACGLETLIDVRVENVTLAALPPGAAWFDPARRVNNRRIASPDDYLPSLSFVHALAAQGIEVIGVKLSPAIEHYLAAEYDAGLEFVSDGGECKEALLWRGISSLPSGTVRAALLTGDAPRFLSAPVDDDAPAPLDNDDTARYLYEPDPAVIRAHLVAPLARLLHARVIDPHIAYLVSDELLPTPFAAPYAILERFDYSRRRLQEALARRNAGAVIIKKRGFPLEPEAVRAQLKLKGTQTVTVILTRRGETHHAFIVSAAGNGDASVQSPLL